MTKMIPLSAALRLARRIAVAIATGHTEASVVAEMSDADLAAFDEDAFEALEAKQAEAEAIAAEPA